MLDIVEVDLARERHARDLLHMMDVYARDPMGGGEPLADETRATLVSALRSEPSYTGLLAYEGDVVVGLANCIRGFSTFRARPTLNVHDIVVAEGARGRGIGQALLAAIEDKARALGCCKLTLEVLSENHVAMAAYRRAGFAPFMLSEDAGHALFWQKQI